MLTRILYIAAEAGEIIRNGFGGNINIEYKTNESNLVTDIDKKAESKIIDFVKTEFPTHNIISEESGTLNNSSEYTWIIDPLDGTTNFAHGLPIFSVSIGVQKNGITQWGVVYDIMRNVFYTAELGSGSFADDKKLQVSSNDNLAHSVLATGFPYNVKDNPLLAVKHFSDFLVKTRTIRRLGSAALDLCYIASGVFDGMWDSRLGAWDICAGQLILEEAGGLATDYIGEKIDYDNVQILASNGKIHSKMMEILQ